MRSGIKDESGALYEMVTCPFCLSVYFALIWVLFLFLMDVLPLLWVPLWVFAVSGGSCVIHEFIHGDK